LIEQHCEVELNPGRARLLQIEIEQRDLRIAFGRVGRTPVPQFTRERPNVSQVAAQLLHEFPSGWVPQDRKVS
jgi:hypothetical protein